MKIVHVVEPFSSGIITFIIHLTGALPQHEHLVIHGTRTTEDEMNAVRNRFSPHVSFRVWKSAERSVNPFRDLKALIELYHMLKKEEYDVLHLHSAKAGFTGNLASFLLGRRNVIYTPNSAPFLRTDVSSFNRRIFRILELISSRMGGTIICCGQSEKEVYVRSGIPCDFINNGIPIGPPPPFTSSAPTVQVGCSAIITYQKNPELFNEIARRTKNSVDFTWIGGGVLRYLLDPEKIRITGWLQKEESQRELETLDIYLSTSLWEGQPFSVLEAMNKGKCLVLYNCPGNRDLVVKGRNGFLFNSADEAAQIINHLADNPKLITEMGKESYLLCAENHNIENTAKLYEQEYYRMAASNQG